MDNDLNNIYGFREVDLLLEEGLSTDLSTLFHDNQEDGDIPDPPQEVPEENFEESLVSLLISELECPVCYQPMVDNLHLPLLCPNGHPCCSSCASRVRRSCPTCRTSIRSWTRCLFLERVGTYMVERAMISEPTDQIVEPVGRRREVQAMRRSRSARLMRAREHMEIWGRRRGEEGTAGDEIFENSFEEDQNSSMVLGEFDQEIIIGMIQDMIDDEEEVIYFSFNTSD